MAELSITIGALTASVSASNAKAQNLIELYSRAIGASGTNQQKANAVVAALAQHMREQAHRQRTNEITSQAVADIATELGALAWEA